MGFRALGLYIFEVSGSKFREFRVGVGFRLEMFPRRLTVLNGDDSTPDYNPY